MYGWDIMPRVVTGGIWRPCYVLEKRQDRIDDLFIWTNNLNGKNTYAEFGFFWNLTVSEDEIRDYTLRLHGECGDSKFDWEKKRLWHTAGRCSVGINNPKLWWPHGYGDANLYDITATLLYKGEPVFEHKARAGLRTIELDRTSTTDKEGHGEFCFHINHTKIFSARLELGSGRRVPLPRREAPSGHTPDAHRYRLQLRQMLGRQRV